MTDFRNFEHGDSRDLLTCEVCEAMCLDAVDGTLTEGEETAFERHVAGCVMCAEQLAEARRGAAWMEMLKGHRPEPPVALLSKILAQTSGSQISAAASAVDAAAVAAAARRSVAAAAPLSQATYAAPMVIAVPRPVQSWRERLSGAFSFGGGGAYLQPRLAMTAAMAFFSIALTMNLSGVRVSDLRPSSLHRTVADVSANAARSFQSLRVVNQVESRVSELRQDERRDNERDPGGPFGNGSSNDAPKQAQPTDTPQDGKPADKPAAPNGSSELIAPGGPRLQQVSGRTDATTTNEEAHPVRKGV